MSVDRSKTPEIRDIKEFKLTKAQQHVADSGIPIYFLNDPNAEVLKVDFIFNAGIRMQGQTYQAHATNSLISEGTTKYTSREISEKLDYYGAYLQNRSGFDDASLTLYCLPKYLSNCLPVIGEILTDAIFSEHELAVLKTNAIQRLKVNEDKISYLSRKAFYSSIFGIQNPYGTPVNQIDIQNISRETLVDLYGSHYKNHLKFVLVSGHVSEESLKEIDLLIKDFKVDIALDGIVSAQEKQDKVFVQKDNSVQSSIRIGREMITRKNPDYRKFQVLNLVLGGYFGSRLMTNIREEKGLTYGIYSVLESYFDAGAFYIDTEMNNEFVERGVKEIYLELGRLRNELIPEKELTIAKNYMLGSFLRSLDGPFALADRYKTLIDFGLDYDYYSEFIDIIKSISALELQGLANKYLQEKDLTEIVVGKR